jgi:hypothetical protein
MYQILSAGFINGVQRTTWTPINTKLYKRKEDAIEDLPDDEGPTGIHYKYIKLEVI